MFDQSNVGDQFISCDFLDILKELPIIEFDGLELFIFFLHSFFLVSTLDKPLKRTSFGSHLMLFCCLFNF